MRSCYVGEWSLFRDAPSAQTTGHYYFTDDAAGDFNGLHHLGSRTWHDQNWPVELSTLGELLTPAHVWNNGEAPALLPLGRVAGSLDCLLRGELLDDQADKTTLIDGFVPTCFAALGIPLTFAEGSAFARCCNQKLWAFVIEWLYDFRAADVIDVLQAWLGPTVTITCHAREGKFPALVTVIHAEFSLCAVEGTSNFQQVALQAFDLIQPPTNFGILSTASLWYDCSNWIHGHLMDDGMQAGTPFFIAGHSYGGCAALILAARYKSWEPNRVIRYFTMGAPKAGDRRLHDLIARCEGINLCNDDDLVTVLPPDRATLFPVEVFLGLPFLFVYTDWIRQPEQVRQDDDGGLTANDLLLPDYATLLAMVQKALAFQAQDPIAGHRINEYRARIERRCPDCDWPLEDAVCDQLVTTMDNTCATAVALERDLPLLFLIQVGDEHWFHFVQGAHEELTLRLTVHSGFADLTFVGLINTCADPFPLANLTGTGCLNVPLIFPFADHDVWFVAVGVVADTKYTIEIRPGVC